MEILDRLIPLLPVVLMIIWVIRFIERIRRQRRAAQQTARKRPAETPAPKLGKSVRERSAAFRHAGEPSKLALKRETVFPKTRQINEFANRAERTAPLDSLLSPAEGARPDKPDRLSRGKPMAVPDSPEQGMRIVEDRASIEPPAGPTGRSPLDAIRARSPLAQAMLWKIIFDRPSALQGPNE